MNPYEESELEAEDWFCQRCGKLISYQEYAETGLCSKCCEEDLDAPLPNQISIFN